MHNNSISSVPSLNPTINKLLHTPYSHNQNHSHLSHHNFTQTQMVKSFAIVSPKLKAAIYLLLLAISITYSSSARILDKNSDGDVAPAVTPLPTDPVATPVTNVAPVGSPAITPVLPTNPVTTPVTNVAPVGSPAITPVLPTNPATTPVTNDAPVGSPSITPVLPTNPATTPVTNDAPVGSPSITPVLTNPAPVGSPAIAPVPTNVAPVGSAVDDEHSQPPLMTFFMHGIVGGTNPSARVVTGIVANTGVNGQLPFSKPNGGVFPINGGVPLPNSNSGILNNRNNLPFLTGLGGGSTTTTIQNNGNNNAASSGSTLPFVSAGQLPTGATIQKLMFGSITVIDDELTEGHELGSSVVGKAQGFYLASSQDGGSQTMALTAILRADHEEDTISFFGIHRTAAPESHIAIVGGTGKYEHAKGYAIIETLHQADQHLTDGMETILQFSVYISP